MAQQALYQQVVESKMFFSQAEAAAWGKQKKEEYKADNITIKVDVNPVDATRRRWKADLYLKV